MARSVLTLGVLASVPLVAGFIVKVSVSPNIGKRCILMAMNDLMLWSIDRATFFPR